MTIADFAALVAAGCVVAAAIADIRRFEIPDGFSIMVLAAATMYGIATPGFDWLAHLTAPLIMFGVGLLAFARGWMGGGDVKLLIAIAAWTGLAGLPVQLLGVAMAGGALAVVVLLGRRGFAFSGRTLETTPKVFQPGAPLPYAVAIASGTLWWAWQAWPTL